MILKKSAVRKVTGTSLERRKALTEHPPQLSDRLDLELPVLIIAGVTAIAFNLLLSGQLLGLSLALCFLLWLLLYSMSLGIDCQGQNGWVPP